MIILEGSYLATDGFRLYKIQNRLTQEAVLNNIEDPIEKILNQKFKYFSKGCQTYVFESLDKNYVLKFIRYNRYEIPLWVKFQNFDFEYKNRRNFYKKKLLDTSLNSYKIAIDELKDETQIIYVHLQKTDNLTKDFQIIDKLNREFFIDLNDFGFVIQKKAVPLYQFLKENKKNIFLLKNIMDSYLETTSKIYDKNIINDDYNSLKNAGVIDNTVYHIDLGSFVKKENLNTKNEYSYEINRFMNHLKKWTLKNIPEISFYLDQQITKRKNEKN